jgi:hypothetical protein
MWQRRAVQFHTSHQLERPIQEDAMGFFWGPRLKCTSARPICCRRPRAAKALVVARALPSYTQKLLCWMLFRPVPGKQPPGGMGHRAL